MEMVGKQMHAWCFQEDGQRHGKCQDGVVMVGKQMLAWYFHEDEQRHGKCQDGVVMVDKQMLGGHFDPTTSKCFCNLASPGHCQWLWFWRSIGVIMVAGNPCREVVPPREVT